MRTDPNYVHDPTCEGALLGSPDEERIARNAGMDWKIISFLTKVGASGFCKVMRTWTCTACPALLLDHTSGGDRTILVRTPSSFCISRLTCHSMQVAAIVAASCSLLSDTCRALRELVDSARLVWFLEEKYLIEEKSSERYKTLVINFKYQYFWDDNQTPFS